MRRQPRFALAGLVLLAAVPAAAEAPELALPVACDMGRVCVVQNYVDTDPGPGAKDHACGPLANDGHGGTDIRAPTFVEMREGISVLAAAPGVVVRLRDGMPDISIKAADAEDLQGREAGNAVVIDHGDGWETQYSHLKQGSLRVRQGQSVTVGQPLGEIGLSGKTEFPHVEFAVRHEGETIDPFTGLAPGSGCETAAAGLWSAEVRQALAYRAGGLLAGGFADAAPTQDAALDGAYRDVALTQESEALVFWALAWGLRGGDSETVRLVAPDGAVLAETVEALPRDKAQWFRFVGRKRPAAGWPPGLYRATYRIQRGAGAGAQTVIDIERTIEVE